MKMNSLIGFGLLGAGAYFVMKYLGYDPLALIGGGSHTDATQTPSTETQTQQQALTTLQLVANAVVADRQSPNDYHSVDFWNYYYKRVRGVDAPSPETLFPNENRDRNIAIGEWWTAMTGKGMTGLGCPTLCNMQWGGLSAIARPSVINPWANKRSAQASAFESAIKRIGY